MIGLAKPAPIFQRDYTVAGYYMTYQCAYALESSEHNNITWRVTNPETGIRHTGRAKTMADARLAIKECILDLERI